MVFGCAAAVAIVGMIIESIGVVVAVATLPITVVACNILSIDMLRF